MDLDRKHAIALLLYRRINDGPEPYELEAFEATPASYAYFENVARIGRIALHTFGQSDLPAGMALPQTAEERGKIAYAIIKFEMRFNPGLNFHERTPDIIAAFATQIGIEASELAAFVAEAWAEVQRETAGMAS